MECVICFCPVKRMGSAVGQLKVHLHNSFECTVNNGSGLKTTILFFKIKSTMQNEFDTFLIYSFPKAHIIFCTTQSSQWTKRQHCWSLIYFCVLHADELFPMMMHISTHPQYCHCARLHGCLSVFISFGKFISCTQQQDQQYHDEHFGCCDSVWPGRFDLVNISG